MPNEIIDEVRQYLAVQDQIKLLTDRKNKLRDSLLKFVETEGEEDGLKGHLLFEINDSVSGISAIQKQKNSTAGYDSETAETILKERGLWETCTELIRVPVEDEIYAARYTDKLTEEDIKSIFPVSITYKLVLKK